MLELIMAKKSKYRKWFDKWVNDLQKEVKAHRFIYFLLAIVLIAGWFIRTYRTDQILGFYFDQGRDALKIWDLWHKHDLFLIGPTTGIAGIFRGPFYYYLIAPFYLIGGGNPVVPSYFLAFLSMLAVVLMFYLGKTIQDRVTGLFAAIIGSFSFYIMVASRWLSNPTPMLLLSMILVWMMVIIAKTPVKKLKSVWWAWIVISLVSGLSLFHFGSSGEFFYLPAIVVFGIWQLLRVRRGIRGIGEVWSGKTIILSVVAFLFTVSPLILFDFLKGHILSQNVKKFFVEDESFKVSIWEVAKLRFPFYYDVFVSKIFHWIRDREKILLAGVAIGFVARFHAMVKNSGIKVVMLLLASPMIGLLFFQGNFGNIYDYYLTGYYLVFILLFAITLGQIWRYKIGKLFVLFFFYVFISWNGMVSRYHIIAGVDGENTVVFGNQKQAVDWIYEDASKLCHAELDSASEENEILRQAQNDKDLGELSDCIKDFNVDVYVPPVIPHAYDYIFKWYGQANYGKEPVEEQIELLYTLYEVDPPHPERLDLWLARQQGIGSVEETEQFGGITVQRRKRF